jgi:hypothetical protein
MKVHSQYVEAMLAEARARSALQDAYLTDDADLKALALANMIFADQVSRDAFDARSQHQLFGASTLAAEKLERIARAL